MRFINFNKQLPQAFLATVITVLIVAGIASATTIGTNITTDGTLTVTGSATLSSTTIHYLTFGNATSSSYAIVGPDTVFTVGRDGAFKFEGNGLLGAYSDSIIQMVGELQIGPLLSPFTTINNNITTSGTLTVSGTTTIDNGTFFVDPINDRVGIGTTTPQDSLHIYQGNIYLSGVIQPQIILGGMETTRRLAVNYYDIASSAEAHFDLFPFTYTDGAKNFNIFEADGVNSEIVVKLSANQDSYINSGNFGVGTTTPQYKLDVNGDINISNGDSYRYNGVNLAVASTTLENFFIAGAGTSSISSILGEYNTGTGFFSLLELSSGSWNSAYGRYSLRYNTSGSYNTAFGANSLTFNTSGNSNTGIGSQALKENVIGDNNTAIGNGAGMNSTGSGNVFLGKEAGMNATGSNQLYITNSDTSATSTLIYGEFDNNILSFNANVGIGTTTPEAKLQVFGGDTSTSTVQIGGSSSDKGACLKLRDSDGAGWSYCTILDGTLSCSQTSCE